MTKNLIHLMQQAQDYTLAYIRQYKIADLDLIRAIYTSHLAFLLNQ